MKRIIHITVLSILLVSPVYLSAHRYGDRPVIQLAVLLDTSNSMDGLINQAKSQLWKIVSETGSISRHGEEPVLEVALYEYGNDGLSAFHGYLRQVLPFTTDLDYVSQKLFELRTNGGSEFCGKVIMDANRKLDWFDEDSTLKLIFIAGNEPFSQGPVAYERAVGAAHRNGITVNTIFCGNYYEGVQTGWQHGARIGGGSYMNIDTDYSYSYIQAPQDERIRELNRRLNDTYLGYGAMGKEKKEMQEAQDENAASMNMGSLLERAKVKSSSRYNNSQWDLVDAYTEGEMDLASVDSNDLPPEMQGLDAEEREAYVEEKLEERRSIQAEIDLLSAERDAYVQEQVRESENGGALDTAVIEALSAAARAKGFELE